MQRNSEEKEWKETKSKIKLEKGKQHIIGSEEENVKIKCMQKFSLYLSVMSSLFHSG